jgi:hypothetical protein
MKKTVISAMAVLLSTGWAMAQGVSEAPADASVYFVNLEDGDTVSSPVTVIFGLSGMGIAPAGHEIDNTGHHHLLINRAPFGEGEEDEMDYAIYNDENHRHFGGGQTQVTLDLPAGEHTLQMVLGDWSHVVHDNPVMSEQITITVE